MTGNSPSAGGSRRESRLPVILILLLSSAFFGLVHWKMSNPWDFHVYLMNGEYLFHYGRFFEPGRPPLVGVVLGLLEFVSRAFAEYGYIALASTFFLFSSLRLARAARLNPVYYYLLACGLGFLQRGLTEGTEILALSFLQLFAASLMEDKPAGHWLGLGMLTRYPTLSFAPLLLFRGRKLWKDLLICLAVQLPWLVYNQITHGSWLESFADLYANNFYFRKLLGQSQPGSITHFLEIGGFALPLALFGLIARRREALSRRSLIVNLIGLIVVVFYFRTPFKNTRFLFSLLLPISYWATKGVQWLEERGTSRAALTASLLAVFAISLSIAAYGLDDGRATQEQYRQVIGDLKAHGLDRCDVESNGWVELSFEGLASRSAPNETIVRSEVESGEVLVIFKNIQDPYYNPRPAFVAQLPLISETAKYLILAKGCKPPGRFDELFMKQKADYFEKARGFRFEERPCHILFSASALQRACELLSF